MTASLFSLDGRVALVTGASRGLGFAMAQGLAEAGATVLLNGRYAETLEAAANQLRSQGLRAEVLPFDVTDLPAGCAAINFIIERHRRLDVMVGNAGVQYSASLDDWTPEEWDRLLNVNLRACFFLAQQASRPMRRQRHGRVIFTSSIADVLGRPTIHAYTASKAGLVGIIRSLAAELGEYGVTCNAISPGYFETDLTKSLLADDAFVARINSKVALRRWGKPRDLAGVVVFLASDAASYVTAQEIIVDGGFTGTME